MIREIGGLAFFNSRPAEAPIVAAPELALDDGLNMLSLALRLVVAGSSARCAGCPDTVRFLSVAGMEDRSDAVGAAFDSFVITFSQGCSRCPSSCALVCRAPMR